MHVMPKQQQWHELPVFYFNNINDITVFLIHKQKKTQACNKVILLIL
jgi:hypothetical protein